MGKLTGRLQALQQALQADDPSEFLQIVSDHVSHKQGCDLEELLQPAQRKDVVAVCLGMRRLVDLGVELLNSEEAGPEEGEAPSEDGQQALGAEVLYSAAALARVLLAQNKDAPPEALQQAAEALHDNALLAAGQFQGLQDEVARLCLEWWQAEAPGREKLTPQTMPYLLVKALQTGTAADVKRCHTMRTALQLFDFDDPCIADLKMLLLRAAFAPSFLRCAEGRRMVAYMFTLQPAFVAELTAIIKNQIPAGRKSMLEAYGEIIFRAWSTCTGACLLNVQQNCIQVLMEAAILASTPAMAASLRHVLGVLHSKKVERGVDKMLLELYEPILFRRLNAANPNVRRNALNLFVDAFPLRDPHESNEDSDKRLREQFAQLTGLLKDAVPEVRVAAIGGVCRILRDFWEAIPGNVTASYIKLMAGELAFDASSPAVRAAVPEGLATLVDTPFAHPLLKLVLPQLEPLLFDSATRVRTAMADLLLSLRGCEALPFYSVVPVEKLLDVLAQDVAPVSERIQRLLLPTFFPNADTGPALVAALLRKCPGAGKAFCQYLVGTFQAAEGGEVVLTAAGPAVHESQVVALINDLRTHLLEAPISSAKPSSADAGSAGGTIKAGKKGRSKRKKGQPAYGSEAAEEEETEAEVAESPESWEAILQGTAALVTGLAALVVAGQCEEEVVDNLFLSGTLVKLLERCPSVEARQLVMAMAAALPGMDASAEVRGRCLKSLLAGDYSAGERAEELRGAVECICAGASCDRLLSVLVTSLNGDPSEVLEGVCKPPAPAATAAAAEEQEPQGKGRGRSRGGTQKKAQPAVAEPAAKKKGKKAAKEEEAELGEVDESLGCEECGSRARGNEMLLCDNCDAAYHMGCLDPPLAGIPEGDWFCPGCDAIMAVGMGKDLAIRCLSLLLELEEQRAALVQSGALARLLPYLEVALQERVDELKQALASSSGAADGSAVSASAALVVYLKGCLHLLLAGQEGEAAGPLGPGITSASLAGQAAECVQQAMEWATTLVQRLDRVDAEAILQAVGTRPAPEAKRSKTSKKKAAASAASQLTGAAVAVKEAFAAAQACVLVLAEAGRAQALASPASPAPSLAQSACNLGKLFLGMVGSMADTAVALTGSADAVDADDVVVAALASVARIASSLAAAARLDRSAGRSLDAALQQVQQQGGAESEQGSGPSAGLPGAGSSQAAAAVGSAAVQALVSELLQLGCQERTSPLAAPALKPSLPGLLATLCSGDAGQGDSGSGAWLRPVAELLSRGIDLVDVPPPVDPPQPADDDAAEPAELAGEGDENAAAAANQPGGDVGAAPNAPPDKAAAAPAAAAGSCTSSEHASHPLVKQLLAAAKLSKVQEKLAGSAACLALITFDEGYARCALGALELSCLAGFKGVTARGRSRAGGDSYATAIQQLRQLKDGVDALPAAELQEARALLHRRLAELFPPAPRVTFEAV